MKLKLKVASINVRGINEQWKREALIRWLVKKGIDILALQETKVKHSSKETHTYTDEHGETHNHTLYFSSSPTVVSKKTPNPKAKTKPKAKPKSQPKAQAKVKATAKASSEDTYTVEHHGVGFIISPNLRPFVEDVVPHNSRFIELSLRSQGPNVKIMNCYMPHTLRPEAEKDHYWQQLETIMPAKTLPTLLVGDFNARLYKRMDPSEHSVIGPCGFGDIEKDDTIQIPDEQMYSRQKLVHFCQEHKLQISNTWFQKDQRHLATWKHTSTAGFTDPWVQGRFEQIDDIITLQNGKMECTTLTMIKL